ncbi:MAG: hypothetical protein R2813_07610 [Flavobacteriales bacterium]
MLVRVFNFCAVLVIVLLTEACSGKSNSELKDKFRWISGQWIGQNGKVTMIERWKWNKHRYEGEGFELNGSDTIFKEQLYLESFGNSYSYVAVLPSGSTHLFQGALQQDGHWMFENAEHDFPSQIHYVQEADTALTITLLANGEPFRGEHSFQLKRVK